ncbi:MAG TPA: hypothetical protein PLI43_01005 [Albidovulum sp.]|uniref:hypothetical protein n=1 Tax=Albidovulum sp. TaxID=1872424 RepID=UPI002C33900A|nr:hypothetical protein [Albidovulum sp.]
MLIGFFLRRIVTVTLCAGSFWLGMKTDRLIAAQPAAPPVAAECKVPADGL